jgi:Uma2 family endonuclease
MATADVLTPPEPDIVVPDGYEMLDGRLVEKVMGQKSCWIGGLIYYILQSFCTANPRGRVYPSDTAYRCFPGRPRHIRKPDVSFVRAERDSPDLQDGDMTLPPDLVVEVISPRETATDLDEKIRDFLSVGVPLIWVVNPKTRTVRIIRPNGSPPLLTESDTLSGDDVLPGFSCRVAEFLPPTP